MAATIDFTYWFVDTPWREGFSEVHFCHGPTGGWDVYLVYTGIFVTPCYTKHAKNPQEPWTTFERGCPGLAIGRCAYD